MHDDTVDCVVVGAGVIGLAVGRALALCGLEVVVVEAAGATGTETSSRNSEVIHAGIYYPFDTLKIDRSFVSDITLDPKDRELVNATIAMAHSLGLTVVAEGVESEDELNYLNKRGCDLAQGYLFSRPLSATDLTAWAEKRRAPGRQQTFTRITR